MSNDIDFLDVDAVAPAVRKTIQVNGKKHEFQSPTVSAFLAEMKRIKRLQAEREKRDGEDAELFFMEEFVESMKASVKGAFPTLTNKDLDSLTMDQMQTIRKFVEAQIDADSDAAEDEEGNG